MVDEILGQDFLTWLWFRSETAPHDFKDKNGGHFFVYMEKKIVVQGGEGESLETASVSGANSQLKEARLGLSMGKKVTRAQIRFEWDSLEYSFSLSSKDFSLSAFKTPKIDTQDSDDPDGLFLEKMYLIEEGIDRFDHLFKSFLNLRLSSNWAEEVQNIANWVKTIE